MSKTNAEEMIVAAELIEKYQLNSKKFTSDRNSILIQDNHVIGLSIQGTNDHSFITSLNSFSFLEELYLYQNGLSQIPELTNCHALKKLGLGGNKIIKISGLESIKQLSELELGRNNLTKIDGLDHLINLRILNLSWNKIAVIENLTKLENLRSLNLMNNQIREIYGLTYLFNLESLNLKGNWINEISGLENCRKLKTLNLAKNQLQKIENIGHLTYLEEFDIEGNPLLPEYEANLDQSGQYWVNKCRLPNGNSNSLILSFIGYSDSGKTASIESLISYLHQSHRKCMALKRIHREGIEFDTQGKNTYRFTHAGAETVIGQSNEKTAVFLNWNPSATRLIEMFTGLINDEISGENDPNPIIIMEGYRDIGDKQILCVRNFEEIGEQMNSRVVALSGAINQDKDACEKAEKEYNLPIFDCLKDPDGFLKYIDNDE